MYETAQHLSFRELGQVRARFIQPDPPHPYVAHEELLSN